jgi:hypothetical protein
LLGRRMGKRSEMVSQVFESHTKAAVGCVVRAVT